MSKRGNAEYYVAGIQSTSYGLEGETLADYYKTTIEGGTLFFDSNKDNAGIGLTKETTFDVVAGGEKDNNGTLQKVATVSLLVSGLTQVQKTLIETLEGEKCHFTKLSKTGVALEMGPSTLNIDKIHKGTEKEAWTLKAEETDPTVNVEKNLALS